MLRATYTPKCGVALILPKIDRILSEKRKDWLTMKCKIGIRPVIDGRWGGIREGLENQTMGMAKACFLYTSRCV